MSGASAVELFGFVLLALSAATGLFASAVHPLVDGRTARWSPEARHHALLLLAVSPLLLATSATLATFTPSFLALVWPAHDHCSVHSGHVHLCLAHPPDGMAHPLAQTGFGVVFAFLTVRSGIFSLEVSRAAGWSARLLRCAAADLTLGARVLPTKRPLCMILGLLRPSIVVSEGLVSSVATHELRAILEHERAHADRRDTLWALVARVSTAFFLPSTRRALLAGLALAAERSSDERAAAALGDRVTMAEVILKVERLLQDSPPSFGVLAASFSGAGVGERVTALLAPPRAPRRLRLAPLLLFAAVSLLFVEAASFHHLLETLVGVLAG